MKVKYCNSIITEKWSYLEFSIQYNEVVNKVLVWKRVKLNRKHIVRRHSKFAGKYLKVFGKVLTKKYWDSIPILAEQNSSWTSIGDFKSK